MTAARRITSVACIAGGGAEPLDDFPIPSLKVKLRPKRAGELIGTNHLRLIWTQPRAKGDCRVNSKLRDECLNEHVFLNLAEARETIEAWRYDYNHMRPHGSLGALTPTEFAVLKGQEMQPPQEGEKTGGLYL